MDEYERKEAWVKMLQLVLMTDPRSDVRKIRYYIKGYRETVMVEFDGGGQRYIDVTADSLGAIYQEVGRAVYEGGAIGEYFPKGEEDENEK